MTTSRSGLRRAVTGALVLPLTGLVLVATAPAASAAPTAPGNGTVFTSYSSFTISADYGRSTSENRLTLTSPSGSVTTIDSAPAGLGSGTLSWTMDTGCFSSSSGSCVPAPNGTWTVTQSGGGTGTSTFVTRIAPKAPQSVSASEVSPREARVSWRKGDEPDLTGWEVVEGDTVVKDGIGRSACDGSTCSAVVTYAVDGGSHTYAVRALRSTAPGSSTTIESPLSSPASVNLSAPAPSPEPTTGGSTGDGTGSGGSTDPGTTPTDGSTGDPSTGGSPGGSGSEGTGSTGGSGGGTTTSGGSSSGGGTSPIGAGSSSSGDTADAKAVAQRKAFALGFSSFGPKLGIPKLPPLPQQAPALAPELADGTYEPTLGFEDQVVTEKVETTGPTAAVRNVVGSALDSERLATSTAGALLLLLTGAHLRRWLGATSEE